MGSALIGYGGDAPMQYHAYEMAHALITPMRFGAHLVQQVNSSVFNPLAHTPICKSVSAACQVFEGVTRRYGKPAFGIDEVMVDGEPVAVTEEVACYRPFGDLLHFQRESGDKRDRRTDRSSGDPKVLIIAPMSGHYATLLRGTVRAMIPDHDVYITDWRDARNIPLVYGGFDFHDFVDYVIDFIRFIGPDTHVIAVCQPSVPALAAAAVMARSADPCQPLSLTLMGGPIDTRRNPTEVNKLAQSKEIGWFESNVISRVPLPHAGAMRRVYPGFIQLSGFMTMNLDRHVEAHWGLYQHLIEGDCDSVEQHRKFYEEYLAVMDLPADFYLETVEIVFQQHLLPDGRLEHRGELVDCSLIEHTTLMTVEGEKDDICGLGQTEAAHALCTGLPKKRHVQYVQPGVGHYGVFNGTRWRTEIQPRIAKMIRQAEGEKPARPKRAAKPSPPRNGVGSLSKAFKWA
ncbi:MAG: polyhydroxyalkanoate depolymerase [Geminicoccaceae bacterium]